MAGDEQVPDGLPEKPLDEILKEAFGPPSAAGGGVLETIERRTGARSRVLLRDPGTEVTPVVRLPGRGGDEEARDDARYQFLGEIARGGVGVVYEGRDKDLGRTVAVKVLRREHESRPEVLERFIEEAQIGGQLQHPGIVPVYGLGITPDGRPFFAMKLVKGETLARRMENRKDVAESRRSLLGVFERVAETMAYAHARGVVHRDLKPSNVMIGAFGEVQVLDWGLAKVLGTERKERVPTPPAQTIVSTVRTGSTGSASMTGSVMGTPAYMPPEQAMGRVEEVDERSDVFALGAILTEILTGEPPYTGDSSDQLVMATQGRVEDALARLAACGADAPVITLAKLCLAPLRRDRPSDAGIVASTISAHLAAAEERARRSEIEAAEEKAKAEEERERERQARREAIAARTAKRRTVLAAAAVLLAVAAGTGFVAVKVRGDRARAGLAAEEVARILREADTHAGAGRWAEAQSLGKTAVARARAAGANDATVTAAEERLAAIGRDTAAARAAAAEAEKDSAMLDRLRAINLRAFGESWDPRRLDDETMKAFCDYGIDVEALPVEDAAARIRGRSIAADLAAALDLRAVIRFAAKDHATREGGRLLAVARLADPDPWRNRLRDAVETRDLDDIRRLAEEADPGLQSVYAVRALGNALVRLCLDQPAAERFLTRAVRAHPDGVHMHFALAWHRLTLDRPAEAAPHFATVLALVPGDDNAWNNLGACSDRLGEGKSAETCIRRALAIDPGYSQWWSNLAIMLKNQGRLEEALAAAREAVAAAPEDPEPRSKLSVVLEAMGALDEAEREIHRAIELAPDRWEPRCTLGNLYVERRGKRAEGEAVFREALRLEPSEGMLYANLARVLDLEGRWEEALATCDEGLRVDPDDAHLAGRRFHIVSNRGTREEIEAAWEGLRGRFGDDSQVRRIWASHLVARGDLVAAEREYREVLRRSPRHGDALAGLGWIAERRADLEEAEWLYRQATKVDDRCWSAWNSLGGLLCDRRGLPSSGEQAVRRAIEIAPHEGAPHGNLGVALMALGRLEEAEAAIRTAIRVAPDYGHARGNLVTLLHLMERSAEAEAAGREALVLSPKDTFVKRSLANVLKDLGRYEEAVDLLRANAEQEPLEALWAHELGVLYDRLGDYDAAVTAARRAIELDVAESITAHGNVAGGLVNAGRYGDAVEACRTFLAVHPEAGRIWDQLGVALCLLDDLAGAEEALRNGIDADPENLDLPIRLAWLLIDTGRTTEAEEHLRLASRFSDSSNLQIVLGWLRSVTGDEAGAREAWAEYLARLRADYAARPSARNAMQLAAFLNSCPDRSRRSPGEALEIARQAIVRFPKYGWAQAVLGVAQLYTGQTREAAETLRSALARETAKAAQAQLRLFLAMALHRSGMRDESRKLLRESADWIAAHRPQDPALKDLLQEAQAVLEGKGN